MAIFHLGLISGIKRTPSLCLDLLLRKSNAVKNFLTTLLFYADRNQNMSYQLDFDMETNASVSDIYGELSNGPSNAFSLRSEAFSEVCNSPIFSENLRHAENVPYDDIL